MDGVRLDENAKIWLRERDKCSPVSGPNGSFRLQMLISVEAVRKVQRLLPAEK